MTTSLISCQSPPPPYKPVCDVRDEWLSQASQGTGIYETAKNAVGIIYKNVFMSSDQFVLEFLQNAEDARFELCQKRPDLCKDKGVFRVSVFTDRIVIENNGKSIDKDDIEGLCYIKQHKRPSAGYKGFIGIGWKSVFKVSARVDVASRPHDSDGAVAFSFSKDAWYNDPSLKDLLSKLNVKPEDVVWELTPIPVEPPSDLERGLTRFTVYVDQQTAKNLSDAIHQKLRGHMFLFLRYINRVEIYDHVAKKQKVIEWSLEEEPRKFNDITIYKYRTLEVEKSLDGSEGEPLKYGGRFLVFSREVTVPPDVRRDRETINANRGDVEEREISIAFELDPVKDEIKRPRGSQLLGVYSFLPLEEVESGLRFLIQADFILQAGRRTINFEAQWNKWTMGEIAKLLRDSLPYLMDNYTSSYLAILDYNSQNVRQEMERLLEETVWKTIDDLASRLSELKALDQQGTIRTLAEVFRPEDDIIYDLLAQNLIDEDDLSYVFNGRRLYPISKAQELPSKIKEKITKLKAEDLLNRQLIGSMLKKDRLRTYRFLVRLYAYLLHNNKLNPSIAVLPDLNGNVDGSEMLFLDDESLASFPQDLSQFKDIVLGYKQQISRLSEEKFLDDEFFKVAVEVLGKEDADRLREGLEKIQKIKRVNLDSFAKLLLENLLTVSNDASRADKQRSSIAKEHLPALTAFVLFTHGLPLRGDNGIWMLSKGGELIPSTKLYARDVLRLLGGSSEAEDYLSKLGITFVDEKSYLDVLNNNEKEFVRLLRNAGVKGLRPCENREATEDLIKKLVNGAASSLSTGSTNNLMDHVKYVKYLKDLYVSCKATGREESVKDVIKSHEVRPNIVLIDRMNRRFSPFTNGVECLLGPRYGAAEDWGVWASYVNLEKFPNVCFISDAYIEADNDGSGWKDFLTNVMGVKSEPSSDLRRKMLGEFGEAYVMKKLKELAGPSQANRIIIGDVAFKVVEIKDVSDQNLGYDILLKGQTDDGKPVEYYIEVKTISEGGERPPLTDNEIKSLIVNRDRYLIAIIKDVPGNPKAIIVPAKALLEERCELAFEKAIKDIDRIKKDNILIVDNVIDLSAEMVDRLVSKKKAFMI